MILSSQAPQVTLMCTKASELLCSRHTAPIDLTSQEGRILTPAELTSWVITYFQISQMDIASLNWSILTAYLSFNNNQKALIVQYLLKSLKSESVFSHVWLLWDPVDCSPPGSSVHWILQARILEWVAISYSKGSDPGFLHCRQIHCLSHRGNHGKGTYLTTILTGFKN